MRTIPAPDDDSPGVRSFVLAEGGRFVRPTSHGCRGMRAVVARSPPSGGLGPVARPTSIPAPPHLLPSSPSRTLPLQGRTAAVCPHADRRRCAWQIGGDPNDRARGRRGLVACVPRPATQRQAEHERDDGAGCVCDLARGHRNKRGRRIRAHRRHRLGHRDQMPEPWPAQRGWGRNSRLARRGKAIRACLALAHRGLRADASVGSARSNRAGCGATRAVEVALRADP